MKTIIKLTGLSLLTTHAVFAQAAAEAFDMDNYKSQCDASKENYLTALQQARDAYPAYMASLKGYKTAVSVHAKHATSQAYIDERVGLGDWQNLLRSKQKKNLRAWGETEETFHFDLTDYTRVYEHSKNIYDVAKTSATKFKKEYLAACQAYEDIEETYFNSLTEGAVDGVVDEEEEGVNTVTDMCSGNTVSADDVDCSSEETNTVNKGAGVTGNTVADCCEAPPVTDMCSGNTVSADDVDCSSEETNTVNKGAGVTGSTVADCCEAPPVTDMCSGNTVSADDVDCSSEETNTVNKGAEVTGSDAATCCEAPPVTGMCSGNTDSTEDVDCSGEATNTQNKGAEVTGSDAATCCEAP